MEMGKEMVVDEDGKTEPDSTLEGRRALGLLGPTQGKRKRKISGEGTSAQQIRGRPEPGARPRSLGTPQSHQGSRQFVNRLRDGLGAPSAVRGCITTHVQHFKGINEGPVGACFFSSLPFL